MKRKLYFVNPLSIKQEATLTVNIWILLFLTIPKIVLQVFLRKNMGERTFNLVHVTLLIIFFYLAGLTIRDVYHIDSSGLFSFYLFEAAFVIMCIVRYMEVKREPSVYDFERYSYDPGEPHSFLFNVKFFGKKPDLRIVELYYEPILGLFATVVFFILRQTPLACFVGVCTMSYFLATHFSAALSKGFILDKIDEIIVNQSMSESFVQDKQMSRKGVPFYVKKPTTEQPRQVLSDYMMGLDDENEDEESRAV